MHSIADVVEDGFCTGCGTCAGTCPTQAITMEIDPHRGVYQPIVDEAVCTSCGLCRRSCPPLTWSNEQNTDRWNPYLGDYLETFAAWSADDTQRQRSASGGLLTSVLLYLLESKEITGAVVTRRREEHPLESEAFIARTSLEIRAAAGSKYSPVTFASVIKTLRSLDPKTERLAVVGLPCHLEGLHRFIERKPKLAPMVRFTLGIVCGQTPSFASYAYSLKQMGVSVEELRHLSNRGDGWPGYMTVTTRDGREKRVPYGSRLSMGTVLSSPLFTPLGCQLCADPCGFTADLSAGDAWLKRFMGDEKGINLAVVRSKELLEIIERMKSDGALETERATVEEFIEANRNVMTHKLVNRQVGLPLLAGRKAAKYGRNVVWAGRPGLKKIAKLLVFYQHLNALRFLPLDRVAKKVNKPVLFYLKALNLLKK